MIINYLIVASTPCQPNPCFNEGECLETSTTTFECDCLGTFYSGKLCEIGTVEISTLPQLVVNEVSKEALIHAKPTAFVTITPRSSEGLTFIPQVVRIDVPQTSSSFKMIASKTGVFEVEFEIAGQNEFEIKQPSPVQVHVFLNKTSLLIDVDFQDLIDTRNMINLTDKIRLQSSCIKDGDLPTGFVSVNTGSFTLPLSVVGLYRNTLDRFSRDGILDPSEEIDSYLRTREAKDSSVCPLGQNTTFTQKIDYVIRNNFFQVSAIKQISDSLPLWLELRKLKSDPEYEAENLMTKLVNRKELEKAKCFRALSVKDAILFPLRGDSFNLYQSNSPIAFKIMSNKEVFMQGDNRICFFTGVVSRDVSVLSNLPVKLIDNHSPDHIINMLESNFVNVDEDNFNQVAVMLNVELKMKSFNGKFKSKSLVTFKDSAKVW